MTHQMKHLCVLFVFHCVEGAFVRVGFWQRIFRVRFLNSPILAENFANFKRELALKISILLEVLNLDLQSSPTNIGVWWAACLKFSVSLEYFSPGGRS